MEFNYCNQCNYLIASNDLYICICNHKYHIDCMNNQLCKQCNNKLNKLVNIIKKHMIKNILSKIENYIKKLRFHNRYINNCYNIIPTNNHYKDLNVCIYDKVCRFCTKKSANITDIIHCRYCNKCINIKYMYHDVKLNKCMFYIYTKNRDQYKSQFDNVIDELKYIPKGYFYEKAKLEFDILKSN